MRESFKYIDIKLGEPVPEKSYAEDCSFTFEAFSDKVDIFVIAHLLGWVGKAIVLRDRYNLLILKRENISNYVA